MMALGTRTLVSHVEHTFGFQRLFFLSMFHNRTA